ncbi:MAG: hypothetical protein QW234_02535, partial [Nitrososphaerota archaeon]
PEGPDSVSRGCCSPRHTFTKHSLKIYIFSRIQGMVSTGGVRLYNQCMVPDNGGPHLYGGGEA